MRLRIHLMLSGASRCEKSIRSTESSSESKHRQGHVTIVCIYRTPLYAYAHMHEKCGISACPVQVARQRVQQQGSRAEDFQTCRQSRPGSMRTNHFVVCLSSGSATPANDGAKAKQTLAELQPSQQQPGFQFLLSMPNIA